MGLFKRPQPIIAEHKTSRDFSYSKDNINLNFKLRVDIKKEMEIFKELLIKAIADIDEELNK